MRRLHVLIPAAVAALLLATPTKASPPIGASLEAVFAEKGQPEGRTGAGSILILTYSDETIVMKDGKVKEVRPISTASTVPDRKVTAAEKRQAAADEAAAAAARTAAASTASWSTDYEGALAASRANGRPVFLFFTGSDWCGWCIKLKREILNTPEFAAYAADHLLLVELDFPRSKPLAPELRSRNEKLAGKYGVRGFPTVIILDEYGKVVRKLGYQPGGPGPFIAELEKL